MKPYSGGVRHDYKDSFLEASPSKRRWPWFAAGVSLPLVAVALLLSGQPGVDDNPSRLEAAGTAAAANSGLTRLPSDKTSSHAADGSGTSSGTDADRTRASRSGEAVAARGGDPASSAGEIVESATTAGTAVAAAGTTPPAGTGAADGQTPPAALSGTLDAGGDVLDLVVEKGDSLNSLFRSNGLSIADLAAMLRIDDAADYLKQLNPGDTLQISHDGGHVLGLTREIDDTKLLSISLDGSDYQAKEIARPVDLRQAIAHGTIKTSLFEAGNEAGISDAVIMAMARIFKWDIDFIHDVRAGDSFTIIYQQQWRKGVKLGDGPILAAEFVNQGHAYRAARFTDPAGHSDYYTPDGHSLRKAFIRAPVDFTRISSKFDMHRYHPILHRVRPHRGVDYAAPKGTPVHAAGDGKVIFRGRKGGYGNVVILKHPANITTVYAHLSRFGKYKVGSRVKQGDVIAYVGMTGLATGPHLHFEYRVNGVYRNPRTVKLPQADPVPSQYRQAFETDTAPLWKELDSREPSAQLATTAAN